MLREFILMSAVLLATGNKVKEDDSCESAIVMEEQEGETIPTCTYPFRDCTDCKKGKRSSSEADKSCEGDSVCARLSGAEYLIGSILGENWVDQASLTYGSEFEGKSKYIRRFGCYRKHCCAKPVKIKKGQECWQPGPKDNEHERLTYMDETCDEGLKCARKNYQNASGVKSKFGCASYHCCADPNNEAEKPEDFEPFKSITFSTKCSDAGGDGHTYHEITKEEECHEAYTYMAEGDSTRMEDINVTYSNNGCRAYGNEDKDEIYANLPAGCYMRYHSLAMRRQSAPGVYEDPMIHVFFQSSLETAAETIPHGHGLLDRFRHSDIERFCKLSAA